MYSVLLETDLNAECGDGPESDSGLLFEEESDEQRRRVRYRVVRLESSDPSEYVPSPPEFEAAAPTRLRAALPPDSIQCEGMALSNANGPDADGDSHADAVPDGDCDPDNAPTSWAQVQALVDRLNREQDLPAFVLSMRALFVRLAALSALALSPTLTAVAGATVAAADPLVESRPRPSKSKPNLESHSKPLSDAVAVNDDESSFTGDSSMGLDSSSPVRASDAAAPRTKVNRTFVLRPQDVIASDTLPPPPAFS